MKEKINFAIKELGVKDIDTLEGIEATLANLSAIEKMPAKTLKEVLTRINNQGTTIFVAHQNNRVVGIASLLIEQKMIHNGGKVGHIEDVATRKGFEGRGIGSALMQVCITKAEMHGCYKIILDCKETLIPFYKKFGFFVHEVGMRKDLKKNPIS